MTYVICRDDCGAAAIAAESVSLPFRNGEDFLPAQKRALHKLAEQSTSTPASEQELQLLALWSIGKN